MESSWKRLGKDWPCLKLVTTTAFLLEILPAGWAAGFLEQEAEVLAAMAQDWRLMGLKNCSSLDPSRSVSLSAALLCFSVNRSRRLVRWKKRTHRRWAKAATRTLQRSYPKSVDWNSNLPQTSRPGLNRLRSESWFRWQRSQLRIRSLCSCSTEKMHLRSQSRRVTEDGKKSCGMKEIAKLPMEKGKGREVCNGQGLPIPGRV